MSRQQYSTKVGDIRPSQLLYTYGVGALIDLPKLSVIVTGLDDWRIEPTYTKTIVEDRLLTAVRFTLPHVRQLLAPPVVPDTGLPSDPFDRTTNTVGVPVATFPRWMVCPVCRLLAPISSGLFELKEDRFHPDRTCYRHNNCPKAKAPEVVPARFLVACEGGHLDDFPWHDFVHQGQACAAPRLRLNEYGPSGEARDLQVTCDSCNSQRRMSEAFGKENRKKLPVCRGRRPHLRDFDPDGCGREVRTLTLGASNTWFPVVLSTVSIPQAVDRLAQLIDEKWAVLGSVTDKLILGFLRAQGMLGQLVSHSDEEIWAGIQARRQRDAGQGALPPEAPDLREPEWEVFTGRATQAQDDDFRLRPVNPPARYQEVFERVVLVERLREVRALIGFTRLDSLGELIDPDLSEEENKPAPLSRHAPTWVPASEVRGEGIFIQFNERKLAEWLRRQAVNDRGDAFLESHRKWRAARHLPAADPGFPGMRYALIHSFAHALMRQLALECGYSAASIRERIYARLPDEDGGPMGGLLLYTSAPDSEGTLGGLVALGEPEALERHIAGALEAMGLCAGDPLCAEHPPSRSGRTLHAAACHACLFAPETSCERGNKYLDRSTLVRTVERDDLAFFE